MRGSALAMRGYSPRMAYLFALVLCTVLAFLSTGCLAVGGGGSSYGYYGGGGIGLFVLIIVAAIIFGKTQALIRRRARCPARR